MIEKHADGQTRSTGGESGVLSDAEKEAVRDNVQHIAAPVELEGVEYSFIQKLRMFDQKYTSNAVLLQMMYRPFFHLRFPVVFWLVIQTITTLQLADKQVRRSVRHRIDLVQRS